MVLDDLSKLGTRTFYSVVASEGVAAIYDFRERPPVDPESFSTGENRNPALLSGCVGVQPARRW
jgi:hypothetical protein